MRETSHSHHAKWNFRTLFSTWLGHRVDEPEVIKSIYNCTQCVYVVRFPKIKTRPRSGVELVLSALVRR